MTANLSEHVDFIRVQMRRTHGSGQAVHLYNAILSWGWRRGSPGLAGTQKPPSLADGPLGTLFATQWPSHAHAALRRLSARQRGGGVQSRPSQKTLCLYTKKKSLCSAGLTKGTAVFPVPRIIPAQLLPIYWNSNPEKSLHRTQCDSAADILSLYN